MGNSGEVQLPGRLEEGRARCGGLVTASRLADRIGGHILRAPLESPAREGSRLDLQKVVEQYHRAADEFSRGNADPVKMLFSQRDDVTLANPFGPAVRGWGQVSGALDYASSRFRDGEVTAFENVATYEGSDLACILEIERWRSRVAERQEVAPFLLRVTSTFRREDDTWKLVHRHADPIATPDPEGPLRRS
jgi:ketosteroid isomerase-like protein